MKNCGLILIVMVLITICNLQSVCAGISPYPDSSFIAGITWDFNSHDERASGSDIWAITWADDGHQYAVWGDGGGFGGTNSRCRVDGTGIGRIEGNFDNYVGYDRHGKSKWFCTSECTWNGIAHWAFGLISIDGVLYKFISNSNKASELYYSKSHGCNWNSAGWSLGTSNIDKFSHATILNMGQDYASAKDNYVYVYAPNVTSVKWSASRDSIELARVPRNEITRRDSYKFFSGVDNNGNPIWDSNIDSRKPIFTWPGRVSWLVCPSFSPGLNRYFLCFNSDSFGGDAKLAIFESPNPWGPWYEIKVYSNWGGFGYVFSCFFAPKWWRNNGKEFTLVFSGTGGNDSWNTVNGSFILLDNTLGGGTKRPPAKTDGFKNKATEGEGFKTGVWK